MDDWSEVCWALSVACGPAAVPEASAYELEDALEVDAILGQGVLSPASR